MKTLRIAFSALVTWAVALLGGCRPTSPDTSALEFNERLVGILSRLDEGLNDEFNAAVEMCYLDSESNSPRLRVAHAAMKSTAQEVYNQAQALEPASSMKSARDYHAAELKYLQALLRMYDEEWAEIVGVAEDRALPREQKEAKVKAIGLRIEQKAQAAYTPLQAAQVRFAKENQITLSN